MVTSDFRPEVEISQVRTRALKKCNITLIYGRIAKILASYRKSGSRNTVMNINVCKFFGLLEEW